MQQEPVFFHVDLDAFFASVEQLDHPEYRGKPVIVGNSIEQRGVVSTCSYEARVFGVHSAMPMSRAYKLCPHAIFLPTDMKKYHKKSREIMQIFQSFSPVVQQVSIDEAFLDMTGTKKLFGVSENSAKMLKKRVLEETGLTVSVGVASNKYIAKIASGLAKPDGLTIIPAGGEEELISRLRLKDIWGIGEKTEARLMEAGLGTIEKLRTCSERILCLTLGHAGGKFLYEVLHGIDPGIFSGEALSRSVSSEKTFYTDITDKDILESILFEISSDVMFHLMDDNLSGRTVAVKIRYDDFRTVSIQETGENPVNDTTDLFARAQKLFRKKLKQGAR
ncbi:DNA polymerase IV [Brucepastera parasyntrophica]|uniref:DNA polymerase IV n=1 Tax=Brucepastera parasyntrophica TaxID=2880008 RepID=UPI0034E28879